MKNFKLDEVLTKIESKREVYTSLIQSTYGAEKETADNIFTSEKEAFGERLKSYFNEQHQKNKNNTPTLTELQGTNIFLEVMQMGLSFAPSAGLVYVSRLKGTGTGVGYQITGKGEIFLAQKSGAIDYITEPVIVRNSEPFKIISNPDGGKVVEHSIDFDNQDNFNFEKDYKCGYVFLVYPNGDKDLRWVDKPRMEKARNLSPSKSLYNDISFLQTKVIRRALRNVRKVPFLLSMHSQGDIEDISTDDNTTLVDDTIHTNVETREEYTKSETVETGTNDLLDGVNLDFDFD